MKCSSNRVYEYILEEPEAQGAPLELSRLPVTGLDDLLWQAGQSSGVEAVTLWTSTTDEFVEECDRLLTWILTFILHHTRLMETTVIQGQNSF